MKRNRKVANTITGKKEIYHFNYLPNYWEHRSDNNQSYITNEDARHNKAECEKADKFHDWFIGEMEKGNNEQCEWFDIDYLHPTLFVSDNDQFESDCKDWVKKTYGVDVTTDKATDKDWDNFSDYYHDFFDGRHYLEYGWVVSGITTDNFGEYAFCHLDYVV